MYLHGYEYEYSPNLSEARGTETNLFLSINLYLNWTNLFKATDMESFLYFEEFEETLKLKKSLKIPKRQSESLYTMAKRKKYKNTNNDLQNIHIKLKIE